MNASARPLKEIASSYITITCLQSAHCIRPTMQWMKELFCGVVRRNVGNLIVSDKTSAVQPFEIWGSENPPVINAAGSHALEQLGLQWLAF